MTANSVEISFSLSNFTTVGVPHLTATVEFVEHNDEIDFLVKVTNEAGFDLHDEMVTLTPDMLMVNSEGRRKE